MMCRARARLHGRSASPLATNRLDSSLSDYVYVRVYTRYNDVEVAEAIQYCTFACVCVGVTHIVRHTHTSDCNTRNVRHIFLPSLSHATITKHTRHDRKTWHLGLCMLQFATFTTQIACVVIVACIELHCVYICVCSRTPFTRTHVVRFGRF